MARAAAYACYRCGQEFPLDLVIDSRGCPTCFAEAPSNLHMVYRHAGGGPPVSSNRSLPSLWRYADRLPFDRRDAISLGEGLTPLLPGTKLGAAIGVPGLLVKNEGCNPTWSHKDRFSTVAITAAVQSGAKLMATSSTGNAGASLAAYAARAGLSCIVATLAGSAGPMLTQIRKYGAQVVPFKDKSDRWAFLAEGVERFGWFATSPYRHPVVGSHPIGIEGYKTIAFEIVEQMGGKPPDWCALPVCYGDALAGTWLGFHEMLQRGAIDRMPKLLAAEVHGSLERAIAQQTDRIPDMPAAFDALAVSIGATRSTFQALKALRQTKGAALAISNAGLVALQEKVAATEGLFLELSSTIPIAAIREARQRDVITRDETVVAVVTASGLKDIDRSASPDTATPFGDVESALAVFANGGLH
ncbi:pyridoxal-phosphate dependent enzyme [Rhizobium sp. SL86]|uniref:pyridoxal-phosphate dependent enzyme n=1 Tax=Rhizobium sp. SL86 TaxID=2995148 RepID=UPI002274A33F|nr:pyridoxal-phosphate dependent enzyme [Rhizobium sp. SL86]MCY1669002.1 pyridoxal-phosphate dependent enzyme [Rhizobium sp. SL86]